MTTEIRLRGANCPTCFEAVRMMLIEDPRVGSVRGSFSGGCLEVERGDMSTGELAGLLRSQLHGVAIAGNGEQVMVEVEPSVGEWHCHP